MRVKFEFQICQLMVSFAIWMEFDYKSSTPLLNEVIISYKSCSIKPHNLEINRIESKEGGGGGKSATPQNLSPAWLQ